MGIFVGKNFSFVQECSIGMVADFIRKVKGSKIKIFVIANESLLRHGIVKRESQGNARIDFRLLEKFCIDFCKELYYNKENI